MQIPTEITRTDVDEVVKTLMGNNAIQITDSIDGSLKFGTAPKHVNGRVKSSLIDLEAVVAFC